VKELLFDFLARAWDLLLEQLTPPVLSVTSPLYWPHIAAALLLSWLVQRTQGTSRRDALSLHGFSRARRWAAAYWHRSARVDYAFYLLNGVIVPLLLAPHLLADVVVRSGVERRLADAFGPSEMDANAPGTVLALALTATIFLAYDLGRFIGHFCMHRVAGLWAFHKVHHSAEVLTPMTNFRVHPVELAVMAASTTVTTGVCAGIIAYSFPAGPVWTSLSLGAAVTLFVFDLGGALLRHSSVWLSYGAVVERVLISPAQHQIHHSVDPRHIGKNLGFALAIWDGLAGTLYVTREREDLRVGLGDGSEATYRSVARAYLVPFVDLLAAIGVGVSVAAGAALDRAKGRTRAADRAQAARQPSRSTTA